MISCNTFLCSSIKRCWIISGALEKTLLYILLTYAGSSIFIPQIHASPACKLTYLSTNKVKRWDKKWAQAAQKSLDCCPIFLTTRPCYPEMSIKLSCSICNKVARYFFGWERGGVGGLYNIPRFIGKDPDLFSTILMLWCSVLWVFMGYPAL